MKKNEDALSGIEMDLHVSKNLAELEVSGCDHFGLRTLVVSLQKTLGKHNFFTCHVYPKKCKTPMVAAVCRTGISEERFDAFVKSLRDQVKPKAL